jgi:CBS domain-containing protein
MDKEIPLAPAELSVAQLSEMIAEGSPSVANRQATLLMDKDNNLVGIITRGDLVRALRRDPSGRMKVIEAGKQELVVSYPDELLHDALGRLLKHGIGRLPVVQRDNPERVVGYLGRASILAARLRFHQEEEIRERGELGRALVPNSVIAE